MPEGLMRCGVPAYAVDLAIAIDHMTLAAVDEGLGTCWIGAFSQESAREILNIPSNKSPKGRVPRAYTWVNVVIAR